MTMERLIFSRHCGLSAETGISGGRWLQRSRLRSIPLLPLLALLSILCLAARVGFRKRSLSLLPSGGFAPQVLLGQ